MRKTVLWGFVLLCVTTISFLGIIPGERKITSTDDTSSGSGEAPVPVAVENFPTIQAVAGMVQVGNFPKTVTVQGTVDVGNFPSSQTVSGSVAVTNLPLDDAGNVRLSSQVASGPSPVLIEMTFLESERNAILRFPLIPLPAGYRTVEVSIQSLDETKALVRDYTVGFGSDLAPLVRTGLGDFWVFQTSTPLGYSAGFMSGIAVLNAADSLRFAIAGTHLQIRARVDDASGTSSPPIDTEYYIRLFLT